MMCDIHGRILCRIIDVKILKCQMGFSFSYCDMTLCHIVLHNETQFPLWQCHYAFFHRIAPRVLI